MHQLIYLTEIKVYIQFLCNNSELMCTFDRIKRVSVVMKKANTQDNHKMNKIR